MWQWHTRTWITDGALNTTARIGLGWYILWFALLAALFLWNADIIPKERARSERGQASVWILWVVGCVVFFLVSTFGVWWFMRATADTRGKTSAIEKTRANGDYRIASYDWFFNQCAAVQAAQDKIDLFTADTSPLGQVNLRAVQATRAGLAREYNAKATATATAGQFRASDLPFQLDPKGTVTCAAS